MTPRTIEQMSEVQTAESKASPTSNEKPVILLKKKYQTTKQLNRRAFKIKRVAKRGKPPRLTTTDTKIKEESLLGIDSQKSFNVDVKSQSVEEVNVGAPDEELITVE